MNREILYFDSAATSYYRPKQVAEAVYQAILTMGNASRGTHQAALDSARIIAKTRQLISDLFDADGAEQIVFTANSTESLNMALKGLLVPGDQVVTTVMEHNSVLRPLYELELQGVIVKRIGCLGGEKRRKGILDMDALHSAICPGVKAVVCTHASNLTGNCLNIQKIGQWCREAGAVFIVDASQTAGAIPISMKESQIDILCFTGHKGLMGPQGTGGMCIKKGISLKPLITGGSGIETYSALHPKHMPAALEAGTLNSHGIAGLYAALCWMMKQGGAKTIGRKEWELAREFYQNVKTIPQITFYGDYSSYEKDSLKDEENLRTAIVTVNIGDADSGEVSDWLAEEYNLFTRSGGHCAPLMHDALGTKEQGAVRFSFSSFNTKEQVIAAAEALRAF